MQTIKNLIPEPGQTPNQSTGPTVSERDAKLINWIFDRMLVICPGYKNAVDGDPDAWAGRYKRELVSAMVEANVTRDDQVNQGLKVLRSTTNPFMPSVGQFVAMCRPPEVKAAHRPYKALPVQRSDPETAASAIQGLRRALHGDE